MMVVERIRRLATKRLDTAERVSLSTLFMNETNFNGMPSFLITC